VTPEELAAIKERANATPGGGTAQEDRRALLARVEELEAALRGYYEDANRHVECPCSLCVAAHRALGGAS
jgi:hypothetical protein